MLVLDTRHGHFDRRLCIYRAPRARTRAGTRPQRSSRRWSARRSLHDAGVRDKARHGLIRLVPAKTSDAAETRRSSEGAEENDAPASALAAGDHARVRAPHVTQQPHAPRGIALQRRAETNSRAHICRPHITRLACCAATLRRAWLTALATAATHTDELLLLDTRVASGALLGCIDRRERDLLASLSDYGTLTASGDATSAASFSSLVNEGEAYAVTMHVAGRLRAGVTPEQIAVQSPYAAQVRLMQCRLREAARIVLAPGAELVEVASVDSFPGREAPGGARCPRSRPYSARGGVPGRTHGAPTSVARARARRRRGRSAPSAPAACAACSWSSCSKSSARPRMRTSDCTNRCGDEARRGESEAWVRLTRLART